MAAMTYFIYRESAWLTTLVLIALMVAAWALGFRWGRRRAARGEKAETGKVQEATLALMGLLLAFTFAMALDKHGRRREMVVTDANAIGDYYTTVSLLPQPVRGQLQEVLRAYTEHRLDIVRRSPLSDADAAVAIGKINAMHDRMTELTRTAVDGNTPVVEPLVDTLNGVTSSFAARVWAATDRLPWPIVMLLGVSVLVSLALLGHGQGVDGKPHPRATLGLILMIGFVLHLTLDLNQPQRGLIRVGQEPLERLLASMSG
jgi:hypothetical protein